LPISISRQIRGLRTAAGLNQYRVAKTAKLHQSVLCRIERDQQEPTPEQTEKILAAIRALATKRAAACASMLKECTSATVEAGAV